MLLASSVCGLFKWRQFEPEVILLAAGWYLRFSLSYRDVEELLAERGLHADHVNVFRAIATAAANYQDMQLVLSIGNNLDPQQIGSLPSNAVVVKSAPQLELLKRASVCITHAGFNTVIESLANGVPQVAIPITHDQPGVAARIADKKTGVFVPVTELSASRLSLLLHEVLTDSIYRDNAQRFQKIIAGHNGSAAAGDVLEEAFGLTSRTGRSIKPTAELAEYSKIQS